MSAPRMVSAPWGVYLVPGRCLLGEGVYLVPGRCLLGEGVYLVPGGCVCSQRVSAPRGVSSPREVSARGVYLIPGGCVPPGGCLLLGGVRYSSPCEQNDKQVQKYYLAPNFVCKYENTIDVSLELP